MKKEFDYEVTCYKDKDNRLGGKLYLCKDMCIDFDVDRVYCESVIVDVQPNDLKFLKAIIAAHPQGISRADLMAKFYDDDVLKYKAENNDDKEIEKRIRGMNNAKYRLNLVFPGLIEYKSKHYRVMLHKSIKRFNDVCKKDVYSIKALFPEAYNDDALTEEPSFCDCESKEFSEKYLHSGAKRLLDSTGENVLEELSTLSAVFKHISTIDNKEASQNNVITDAYNIIVEGCYDDAVKEVLKIKGPLGSYKNRIMQYLYLAVCKNNADILPFYIDIAFYERIRERDVAVSEENIIEQIDREFDVVEAAVGKNKSKIPLVFLDGVRDFSRGNESLYSRISNRINKLNSKVVMCFDADFTVNPCYSFNIHPLGNNGFAHFMRISSMELYREKDSIDFISNCLKLYGIEVARRISAEEIYNNLIRLKFYDIDAYWLIYILKTAFRYFVDSKSNIVDLYTAICMSALGNAKLLDSAAQMAYEFEFESKFADNPDLNYDIRWRLIRRHRSVLDFLIAKHYAKKLITLKLTSEKTDANTKQLSIFNMVIQENISRFAFVLLNGNDDYEHQIMRIAKSHYDELSQIGKSELTFRMTALGNPRRKSDSVRLIRGYVVKETECYSDIPAEDLDRQKDSAFLLRSLYINLIYEDDKEAFIHYFNQLLTDKEANAINRGFHLEYYGDKSYIPNKSLLDFEDDVRKGKRTFNLLCLALNERMRTKKLIYGAAIELLTLCNLIQARIEHTGKKVFDVMPYISNCLTYLKWIVKQPQIAVVPNVVAYFNWMYNELKELLAEATAGNHSQIHYNYAAPFNKFSIAKSVERTGWIKSEIPEPENIVEHMYNCWLVGVMYLPDDLPEDGYNKNIVLQMLLIHDLVEAKTGNINRPEREQNEAEYDMQENNAMQALFLSGTYPGSVDLSEYRAYWNMWNQKEGINYYIAKDIDNIQTIYQFCDYYNQNMDNFTDDDIVYWLNGIDRLETYVGQEIAQKLIVDNPKYATIVSKRGKNNCEEYF